MGRTSLPPGERRHRALAFKATSAEELLILAAMEAEGSASLSEWLRTAAVAQARAVRATVGFPEGWDSALSDAERRTVS